MDDIRKALHTGTFRVTTLLMRRGTLHMRLNNGVWIWLEIGTFSSPTWCLNESPTDIAELEQAWEQSNA